jgi:hypothetical protein
LVFLILLVGTYGFKISEEFQKQIVGRDGHVAQMSASWMLGGSAFAGILALVLFTGNFGIVGGIVGASTFFVVGGAVGAIAHEGCACRRRCACKTSPLASPSKPTGKVTTCAETAKGTALSMSTALPMSSTTTSLTTSSRTDDQLTSFKTSGLSSPSSEADDEVHGLSEA